MKPGSLNLPVLGNMHHQCKAHPTLSPPLGRLCLLSEYFEFHLYRNLYSRFPYRVGAAGLRTTEPSTPRMIHDALHGCKAYHRGEIEETEARRCGEVVTRPE